MALPQLAASPATCAESLARRGYVLLDGSGVDRAEAAAAFDALLNANGESQRVAPDAPLVAALLAQPAVRALVDEVVGPGAKPVRVLAFDKTERGNWFVPWHQDRTIAVKARADRAAVTHWTVKGGVAHCEAPAAFLEKMLTLRWHLDLIGPADGGLRVLPGSHLKGRLTSEEIAELAQATPAVELAVSAGTVLALRPLLVHGSRRRTTQGHRRILHVELAAGEAPPPLEWAWV